MAEKAPKEMFKVLSGQRNANHNQAVYTRQDEVTNTFVVEDSRVWV